MKKAVRGVIPNYLYVTLHKMDTFTFMLLKYLLKLMTLFKERIAVAGWSKQYLGDISL